MTSPDHAVFGYRIRPADGGWTWVTYGLRGEVLAQGAAPNKALAAACVVRALARAAAPAREAA